MPNNTSNSVVAGQILTVQLGQSFPDSWSLRTADGGRLVCKTSGPRDPADGPPEVTASFLASVSALPNRESDEVEVFNLTTALVDADGRLWQRTRAISAHEIWAAIVRRPVLYEMVDPPSKDPMYCHAEAVTRRVVFEPVDTMIDNREHHLVEVLLADDEAASAARERIPYAKATRLLFRLRFKYFGAQIGLVEDRTSFRTHTGQLVTDSRLLVTIQPTTDTDMIVAMNQQDKILSGPETELLTLGPLCSRDARLPAGWEKPAWGLPVQGDITAWEHALRQTGADPSTMTALKPNPSIHYEPRPVA